MLDFKPATSPEPELETPELIKLEPQSESEQETVEDVLSDLSLDPEIDYIKPADLRQFKPAAEIAPAPAAPEATFTLALEEEPERQGTARAAFIADPVAPTLPEEPAPAAEVTPVSTITVAPSAPVGTAAVPLRASRVDEAQEPELPLGGKPERPRFKVPGFKSEDENRKRESARAVFNAKTGSAPKGRNTRRLIVLAALLALIPLAGGGFLLVQELGLAGAGPQFNIPASSYDAVRAEPVAEEQPAGTDTDIQLDDVTQDAVASLETPVDAATTAAVTVQTEPAPEPAVEVDAALAPAEPSSDAVPATPELAPVPAAINPELLAEVPVSVPEESVLAVVEAAAIATPAPVSATPPPSPINITRSNAAPQVNVQLTQAYNAFSDQDYFAARTLYQQALRELPNNRDALLGLAATAIQLGDVTGARITYTKLLELDPRDVLARVGLMDSMPMGDSVQTETQLLSLKTEHPDVAQLAFALGNFYASQRRWNEAQAAYYDALLAAKAESGSQVSPDFAFNLAVSLERLNQQQPAFDFYREALEQARVVNPGFDVRVLRERLDALERVLP
jgi:Tfp pilus assembly protein PilF